MVSRSGALEPLRRVSSVSAARRLARHPVASFTRRRPTGGGVKRISWPRLLAQSAAARPGAGRSIQGVQVLPLSLLACGREHRLRRHPAARSPSWSFQPVAPHQSVRTATSPPWRPPAWASGRRAAGPAARAAPRGRANPPRSGVDGGDQRPRVKDIGRWEPCDAAASPSAPSRGGQIQRPPGFLHVRRAPGQGGGSGWRQVAGGSRAGMAAGNRPGAVAGRNR